MLKQVSDLLSEALLSLFWSTWPRSALSFLSFSSWASTLSLSLRRRSCSAATCWCLASCCFRNLSLCSLAASSCRWESICCCWRQAISSSSLSVNSTPSRNWNRIWQKQLVSSTNPNIQRIQTEAFLSSSTIYSRLEKDEALRSISKAC